MQISLKTALMLLGIGIILALIPSGILFWKMKSLEDLAQQRTEQQDIDHRMLTEFLQRASSDFVTPEMLQAFAEENHMGISEIQRDLSSLGADLRAVASTKANTTTVVHNHYTSTSTTPSDIEVPTCPDDGRPIDVHGYTAKIQHSEIRDEQGMRVADVSFEAASDQPWTDTVYGLDYEINSAIGEVRRDGRLVLYTELTVTSSAEPDRRFRIAGVDSQLLQVPRAPATFQWVDPRLFLSVSLGGRFYNRLDFSASLGVNLSIMSYGDWSFIGIGLGYDAYSNAFSSLIIPFAYNIGGPIPFLSDLHIFPYVGIILGSGNSFSQLDFDIIAGLGLATRL